MRSITRTKLWVGRTAAVVLLAVMGLSLSAPFLVLPVSAQQAAVPPSLKVEKGVDVYYKTEGIATGLPAPKLSEKEYTSYYVGTTRLPSRVLLWMINQQHLYYGSFVLAVPMFVLVLEFVAIITRDRRYDKLAYEFVKISLTAYSVTALLGGLVIFTMLAFYGDFFRYIANIYKRVMHVYALMFLAETCTLYIYYYGWDWLQSRVWQKGQPIELRKWVHLSLCMLLNTWGYILMILANTWLSFMMSPAGVDEKGRFLGNIWHAIHTALWNPVNIHRILGNGVFGGGIVAAYAAFRFLASKTDEERAYYDWMGYIAMFMAVSFLIPLPFAGYWLMREVFAFRQQMGITLMGGILAWLFIVQAVLIGALFLGTNYYLWLGMGRMPGSERYMKYIKYMVLGLGSAFIVWLTPHTYMMTLGEVKAMGGTYHPLIGPFGVMSAKNGAVNTIITTTVLAFLLYQRCNKIPTVKWAPLGNAFLTAMFVGAYININWISIYGYSIPANVRVGLSVPQVATTLSMLFLGSFLNLAMLKGAKMTGPVKWGTISVRSQFAMLLLAVSFTWLMALMGYIRSSVRLFWHVNEIMRDNSPDAFTQPLGTAANVISSNVLIFWTTLLFVFWVSQLSYKKRKIEHEEVPAGDIPAAAVLHRDEPHS